MLATLGPAYHCVLAIKLRYSAKPQRNRVGEEAENKKNMGRRTERLKARNEKREKKIVDTKIYMCASLSFIRLEYTQQQRQRAYKQRHQQHTSSQVATHILYFRTRSQLVRIIIMLHTCMRRCMILTA